MARLLPETNRGATTDEPTLTRTLSPGQPGAEAGCGFTHPVFVAFLLGYGRAPEQQGAQEKKGPHVYLKRAPMVSARRGPHTTARATITHTAPFMAGANRPTVERLSLQKQ